VTKSSEVYVWPTTAIGNIAKIDCPNAITGKGVYRQWYSSL